MHSAINQNQQLGSAASDSSFLENIVVSESEQMIGKRDLCFMIKIIVYKCLAVYNSDEMKLSYAFSYYCSDRARVEKDVCECQPIGWAVTVGEEGRRQPNSAASNMNIFVAKQNRIVENLRKSNQKLRQRNSRLNKLMPPIKAKRNFESFMELFGNDLPVEVNELVRLSLSQQKSKGMRYSKEAKRLAVNIYTNSPKCYRYLQPIFKLPSKSTLLRVTRKWQCCSGINEFFLSGLAAKLQKSSELSKYCVICIDEIRLQPLLTYSKFKDEVIGVSDCAQPTIKSKIGTHATVLMARGLYENWKQPICYWIVRDSFKAVDLETRLKPLLLRFLACGFQINAIVSDMGSNFSKLATGLGVTPDQPYFFLNDVRIPYIFDVPHLLKATRNCLKKHFVSINGGGTTTWTDIEYVFNADAQRNRRMAPKITNSHINPSNLEKMRVKYAAQVISTTMTACLDTYVEFEKLPTAALATSEYVFKFDNLFDLLNSSTGSTVLDEDKPFKAAFTGQEFQTNYLTEMKDFIKGLVVFNADGKNMTNMFSFLTSWLISMQAVQEVWNDTKHIEGAVLFTRRLNQDPLENFFGLIRNSCGNNRMPTVEQFVAAYKKYLYHPLVCVGDKGNCESDRDDIFFNMSDDPLILTLQADSGNLDDSVPENAFTGSYYLF